MVLGSRQKWAASARIQNHFAEIASDGSGFGVSVGKCGFDGFTSAREKPALRIDVPLFLNLPGLATLDLGENHASRSM